MSEDTIFKAPPVVAVVGTTGHTAHFVINELLRRKMSPVAIARNSETPLGRPESDAASATSASEFRKELVFSFATVLDDPDRAREWSLAWVPPNPRAPR